MADKSKSCPTDETLRALVDGLLPANAQSVTQAHVDHCTACQKTLELLVAGTASWDAAMNHLKREVPRSDESVLSDAIKRMKVGQFAEAAAMGPANPLEFLDPSDTPGSIGKLGPYEVTEVVGQGGMGIVLKAFDPALHRVVAVKVLAPYLAHNPQARKRFVREAQAIAAVSHDHVITIHAIDESAEQPKIVMQYIHGRSLQQKLDAEGSLDLKEILRIGMQTAAGLSAAHAQGLVHRDIKPSNILLENSIQRVKLTDFGLARAVDDASLTQSGVIAGTPQYMAPEQANGDAVDHRADLFSLGSVLYAMCVGHSPFRASTTMGVLKRVCHDPPRPIQELNPDIPNWLCSIVMKLLEKKPEDRIQTAKEVAELLEKWLAHVQQPQKEPRPPQVAMPTRPFTAPLPAQQTHAGTESAFQTQHRPTENHVHGQTTSRQAVTWRWVLFFILSGMIAAMIYSIVQPGYPIDAALVGVLGGLITCFCALIVVAVVRFMWASFVEVSRWSFRAILWMAKLLTVTKRSPSTEMNERDRASGESHRVHVAASSVSASPSVRNQIPDVKASPAPQYVMPRNEPESKSFVFHPISGWWFLFCLIAGVAITVAMNEVQSTNPLERMTDFQRQQYEVFVPLPARQHIQAAIQLGMSQRHEMVEVISIGLGLGFAGFLLLLLLRGLWAQFRTVSSSVQNSSTIHHATDQRSTEDAKASTTDAKSSSTSQASLDSWPHRFIQSIAWLPQKLTHAIREFIRRTTGESLWIGWCVAGCLELLVAMSVTFDEIPYAIETLAMSVVSFVVSHCIHARQNLRVVRAMSFVGLLPISYVAWFRIPLSIVTLLWQRSPATQDSFEKTPWPETRLGNLVNTYVTPHFRK